MQGHAHFQRGVSQGVISTDCQHPDLYALSSHRRRLNHEFRQSRRVYHVASCSTLFLFNLIWNLPPRNWMIVFQRASVSAWHHRQQCHLNCKAFHTSTLHQVMMSASRSPSDRTAHCATGWSTMISASVCITSPTSMRKRCAARPFAWLHCSHSHWPAQSSS